MANEEQMRQAHQLRIRRRMRQLLGAVICFLVLVGIVSLVQSAFAFIGEAFDDTKEKEALAMRLSTLVALDPVPFSSLEQANRNTLLNAAIWASIKSDTNYERDEAGAMYLPTLDIDATVAALYGPDFKFEYATFEDHGMKFTYVPEKKAFLLPITSAVSDYSPLVTKIKGEKDGVKRVTVGYVSPFNVSGEFSPGHEQKPVKYQDYLFRKNKGEHYLFAIVESETKAEHTESSSNVPAFAPERIENEVVPSIQEDVVVPPVG